MGGGGGGSRRRCLGSGWLTVAGSVSTQSVTRGQRGSVCLVVVPTSSRESGAACTSQYLECVWERYSIIQQLVMYVLIWDTLWTATPIVDSLQWMYCPRPESRALSRRQRGSYMIKKSLPGFNNTLKYNVRSSWHQYFTIDWVCNSECFLLRCCTCRAPRIRAVGVSAIKARGQLNALSRQPVNNNTNSDCQNPPGRCIFNTVGISAACEINAKVPCVRVYVDCSCWLGTCLWRLSTTGQTESQINEPRSDQSRGTNQNPGKFTHTHIYM